MKKTGLLFLQEQEFEGVVYEVYEDLETGERIVFRGGLTAISGK